MKRGILLCAFWSVAAVLVVPNINRAVPPPDCSDCNCSENVSAWRYVSYDSSGAPTFNNPTVLKAWDKDNPDVFGNVTPTAHWKTTTGTTDLVYSTNCLKDAHAAGTTTCKFIYYSENWAPLCKTTASQPPNPKALSGYYQPVAFDANSVNYTVGIVTNNYTCGTQ